MVSCTLIVATALGGNFLLSIERFQHLKSFRLAFGLLSSVLMSYLLPTLIGMCTLMLLHHQGSMLPVAFGLCGLAATFALTMIPFKVLHSRLVVKGVKMNPKTKKWILPGPTDVSFGFRYFYDVASDPNKFTSAMNYFEDLGVAFAMSFVGSIQPRSDAACWAIAGMLTLIAFLHFFYLLYYKPIRTKMDNFFAVAIASLQVLLSILVLIATKVPSVAEYAAYVAIGLGASFAVQTVTMGIWTIMLFTRRKRKSLNLKKKQAQQSAANEKADGDDEAAEEEPENLLQVPLQQRRGGRYLPQNGGDDEYPMDRHDAPNSMSDDDFSPQQHHNRNPLLEQRSDWNADCEEQEDFYDENGEDWDYPQEEELQPVQQKKRPIRSDIGPIPKLKRRPLPDYFARFQNPESGAAKDRRR